VSNSQFSGTLSTDRTGYYSSVGGLVGETEDGFINRGSGVRDSTIHSKGNYTGGVVGYIHPNNWKSWETHVWAGISDCFFSGAVTGGSNDIGYLNGIYNKDRVAVGGVAGENDGIMMNRIFEGEVTGTNADVGGLAGQNFGVISDSTSHGVIKGFGVRYTGGLVGWNGNQTPEFEITGSFSSGTVKGGGNISQTGQIIGLNQGASNGCSSTSKILLARR